jgi:cathepsin A (carboxypeptidase C)
VRNPYSWNEVGHVLYVEQPLRTGFSKASKGTDLIRVEEQIADDFYAFLVSFYDVFPQYAGVPLIISGESYAGKYIPNIAQEIVKRQLRDKKGLRIDLAGVAIGNGSLDPVQDLSHAEYAYVHGLIPLGAKLAIEQNAAACLDISVAPGSEDQKDSLGISADADRDVDSLSSLDCDVTMMSHVLYAAGQPNEYNTATFTGYDNLLSADGVFHTFFNDPDVQRALHVVGPDHLPARSWNVCNDETEVSMADDQPVSSVPALQFLANHTRVLLYAGENDLNCNFLGIQNVLQGYEWRGKSWQEAERSLYRGAAPHGKEVYGEYFSIDEDRMAFLIIRNSGHLVPMDQPAVALDLIRRFAARSTFADVKMPNEQRYLEQLSAAGKKSRGRAAAQQAKEFKSFLTSTLNSALGLASDSAVGDAVLILLLVSFIVGICCLCSRRGASRSYDDDERSSARPVVSRMFKNNQYELPLDNMEMTGTSKYQIE